MWTREKIENLLAKNDEAVIKALLRIYEGQTFDEKRARDTKYLNGRGFSAAHASVGSSMVEFYKKNGFLSQKQIRYWRVRIKGKMRIARYSQQLLNYVEQQEENAA